MIGNLYRLVNAVQPGRPTFGCFRHAFADLLNTIVEIIRWNTTSAIGSKRQLHQIHSRILSAFSRMGVPVPRFPSIPQLSIVVPVGHDVQAFETSLVSVLENRPEHCEILVAHDGTYDDPFRLEDEVRFVTSPRSELVQLVQEGARQARGRFVHLIGEGVRATEDWTCDALTQLDRSDVGFVAPTIRHHDGSVLACGWTDTPHRLCDPLCSGSTDPAQGDTVRAMGAYLQASFWRRDLLRSLSSAFLGDQTNEATYAYGLLARRAGWKGQVSTESDLVIDEDWLPWDDSNFERGRRLRAIRHQLSGGGWGSAITAGLRSATACLVGQVGLGEALGQATAPLAESEIELLLFAGETLAPDEVGNAASVKIPTSYVSRHAA